MVPQQLFVLRHNPHLLFELLASLTPTDFSIGCNLCSGEFYIINLFGYEQSLGYALFELIFNLVYPPITLFRSEQSLGYALFKLIFILVYPPISLFRSEQSLGYARLKLIF